MAGGTHSGQETTWTVLRAPACSGVPSTPSEVRTGMQEAAASSRIFPGSVPQVTGS